MGIQVHDYILNCSLASLVLSLLSDLSTDEIVVTWVYQGEVSLKSNSLENRSPKIVT